MSTEKPRCRRARGMTLLELAFAVAFLATGTLCALLLEISAQRDLVSSKEREVARLEVARVREMLRVVRFRQLGATDTSPSLFKGNYEIARNADGSVFKMPDLTAAALVTNDDGIGNCLVVRFPVPPLRPIAGRTNPGTVCFYAREANQADGGALGATNGSAKFPFAPTPGLAFLDCDADGGTTSATSLDLRTARKDAANPLRLMPAKVRIDWRTLGNTNAHHEECFVLSYPGYD